MRLVINVDKTKYLAMTRNAAVRDNLSIEGLIFEQVEDLKYLGVNINENKNIHNDIRMRLNAANMCYFSMKEKLLSRWTKKRLYCA